LDENVDIKYLAVKYELSGGFIKNALLSAILSAISRENTNNNIISNSKKNGHELSISVNQLITNSQCNSNNATTNNHDSNNNKDSNMTVNSNNSNSQSFIYPKIYQQVKNRVF
jgi:hypothetical protein